MSNQVFVNSSGEKFYAAPGFTIYKPQTDDEFGPAAADSLNNLSANINQLDLVSITGDNSQFITLKTPGYYDIRAYLAIVPVVNLETKISLRLVYESGDVLTEILDYNTIALPSQGAIPDDLYAFQLGVHATFFGRTSDRVHIDILNNSLTASFTMKEDQTKVFITKIY